MSSQSVLGVGVFIGLLLLGGCAAPIPTTPTTQEPIAATLEERQARHSGPRVHVPNPIIDAGTSLDTMSIMFEVVVENLGDEPLRLRGPLVPGISTNTTQTLVEPTASVRLPIHIDTRGLPMGKTVRSVAWSTNDPINPILFISIRFEVCQDADKATLLPISASSVP